MTITPFEPKLPFNKYKFAHRLRELRAAYGQKQGKSVKQEDMAELLGVSRRTYVDWESPTKLSAYPREMNVLISIAEIFETDLIFLITGMFDGQKERQHEDQYVNIYTRYINDPHFHLLLKILMRFDSDVIRSISEHYEAITDFYEGKPLI